MSLSGTRPFSQEEVDLILQEMSNHKFKERNSTYFILACNLGFRVSEILSMKIGDVYNGKGKVNQSIEVKRQNMKGKNKGRIVVVNPVLKKNLEEYYNFLKKINKASPNDPLIYSNKTSKALKYRQIIFIIKSVCRSLELSGKIASHSCRKTFAKNVYKELGNDVVKLQVAMGHADVSSTIHYIQKDAKEVNDAIMKIGEVKEDEEEKETETLVELL